MRKVMVSELKKQPDGNWKLEEKGVALFHCFGVNYEDLRSGPGNYSSAIIEWPSGAVSNVSVELVRFISE